MEIEFDPAKRERTERLELDFLEAPKLFDGRERTLPIRASIMEMIGS